MGKFYLTTTLPYVNDKPHVGFALEIIQADAIARYKRLMGEEVFFNTGVDEHGQKIFEAAEKEGKEVQAFVDHYAEEFQKLKDALNLSYDKFIRTTDPEHEKAAQEMWRRCEEKGDIYKKEYEGLYCVGCEAFVTEKDLVDGKCADHGKEPQLLKEENYFFRFSKYEKEILEYLSNTEGTIPDWRREEAIAFVKNGLGDFSISREKERLQWGVPVPGDDSQVMYVWFDALTNYISTLGWPEDKEGKFKDFWEDGHTLQVGGKDQIRFQSLIFQAMLISAGIKNTDQIFYHGFINSGGKKMSKSLGNVINPLDLVEQYGTDSLRYILLRHLHPVDDSDMTDEKIHEWYTANLVNGLGNLVSRVLALSEKHLEEPIEIPEPGAFPKEYTEAIESFEFNKAMDYIWKRIGEADLKITETEPFKLIKTDPEKAKQILRELLEEIYWIGRFLYPFLPEANEKIKKAVAENKKPEILFERK